ncbi:unnamed protein product [Protopolystoma xenopodis]|uniref:Uncharacterized protein n=1 Tax=Protopolystoma xenopodis TaxID=117903 RepID=A0A3S5A4A0_9PLAT|nr:unnamed protein product [Protopolystoma xenopodis]
MLRHRTCFLPYSPSLRVADHDLVSCPHLPHLSGSPIPLGTRPSQLLFQVLLLKHSVARTKSFIFRAHRLRFYACGIPHASTPSLKTCTLSKLWTSTSGRLLHLITTFGHNARFL